MDSEPECCPLCMEELDATDKATLYCECNYQVCNFCWQQLHDNAAKENTVARCPNCRMEYDRSKVRMLEIAPEELDNMRKRKGDKRVRPAGVPALAGHPRSKRDLANIRVLQKNLVYAVGLAPDICDEELLKSTQYFGQFGKILKLSVTRPPIQAGGVKTASGSAYITYKRVVDAERCIKTVDDVVWFGRHVRACYGTTKYCNAFLKNLPCNNSDCLYLHSEADEDLSFTKEEMAHIGPAKFAGHTGLPPSGHVKQAVVGGLGRDGVEDIAVDTATQPIAVPPRTTGMTGRPDVSGGAWDSTGGGMTPSPPSRPSNTWASTVVGAAPGAPGLGATAAASNAQQAPPAVDSEADFPELSSTLPPTASGDVGEASRPTNGTLKTAVSGNGLSMADIARAASGQPPTQTAAARLKARKEDGRKLQSLSSPSKVERSPSKGAMASGINASASSLSELDPGSRPESRQQNGSGEPLSECESPEGVTERRSDAQHTLVAHALDLGDGNDEDEQSQLAASRTASSAVWQLLEAGDVAEQDCQQPAVMAPAGAGGMVEHQQQLQQPPVQQAVTEERRVGNRPPPPGFGPTAVANGSQGSTGGPPPGFEDAKPRAVKKAPPPGFEHVVKGIGQVPDSNGTAFQQATASVRQWARLPSVAQQFTLEAILQATEVILPTYGRIATQSRFAFARKSGSPGSGWGAGAAGGPSQGPLGMELLRHLQSGAAAGQQTPQAQPSFAGYATPSSAEFRGFPSPPPAGPSPTAFSQADVYNVQQKSQWQNV